MVRDDLLEQIRQPLWDRIDRRMAVILAVSIGAHLAIAIASWLGDPPRDVWLPGDEPRPAFTAETLDTLVLPEPGVAAVAPAPAAPKAVAAAPAAKQRRGNAAPERIDPRALVNDLVGDGPSFQAASRRVGRGLEEQLDDAREAQAKARVGKDGVPEGHPIGEGEDADVGEVDGPTRTAKSVEVSPPEVETKKQPEGIDYDPSDDLAGAKLRALERCYQQSRALGEGDGARVELTVTIGTDGRVTAASARGPSDLAHCVKDRARAWSFPVELPAAGTFAMTMVFVPSPSLPR
jgi:hypothetical protein